MRSLLLFTGVKHMVVVLAAQRNRGTQKNSRLFVLETGVRTIVVTYRLPDSAFTVARKASRSSPLGSVFRPTGRAISA